MLTVQLIGSLIVLTIGAELLVRGASAIARRTGLSSFFIGLTIVGFGTSSPELFASITAALDGSDAIAVGNVVGSNIFNIAIILGLSAVVCPIPIHVTIVRREVLLVIAVTLIIPLAWLTAQTVARWEGALMVVLMAVYLWRGYVQGRRESPDASRLVERNVMTATSLPLRPWRDRLPVQGLFITVGLAMLVVGAWLLVDGSVHVARKLGVSELAIGLTLVAGGTSVPELATSIIAAVRRHSDIAVGNVLGSNIFNILGVLGMTAVVKPQAVGMQTISLDVPVMFALSVACLPIMLSHARISRTEGVMLIACYGVYVGALFTIAPRWFG